MSQFREFLTSLFRPRVVMQEYPEMKREDMVNAWAVPDTDPRWRSILQLIRRHENIAIENAQKTISDRGLSASYNGGAEFLARVRDDLVALRKEAVQQDTRQKYEPRAES